MFKQPKTTERPRDLDIIREFEALDLHYKMALCEAYFDGGEGRFMYMADLFWPQAGKRDIKRLRAFLVGMKAGARRSYSHST